MVAAYAAPVDLGSVNLPYLREEEDRLYVYQPTSCAGTAKGGVEISGAKGWKLSIRGWLIRHPWQAGLCILILPILVQIQTQ